jgi:dimethylamine monooxygenase subunit A
VFGALQPDTVLERFNWTVQAGPERYTPSGAALRARAAAAHVDDAAGLLHLRVERQTIRKLPQTGAVLFTIRISIDPLAHALAAPGAAGAFAKAWFGTPEHVRGYKKWAVLQHLVARLLSDLGQNQP